MEGTVEVIQGHVHESAERSWVVVTQYRSLSTLGKAEIRQLHDNLLAFMQERNDSAALMAVIEEMKPLILKFEDSLFRPTDSQRDEEDPDKTEATEQVKVTLQRLGGIIYSLKPHRWARNKLRMQLKAGNVVPQDPRDRPIGVHAPPGMPKVVLTGAMGEPRKVIAARLKDRGYWVTDYVSESGILVCADATSTSSKMQKARQLGVQIMTEQEMRDTILAV